MYKVLVILIVMGATLSVFATSPMNQRTLQADTTIISKLNGGLGFNYDLRLNISVLASVSGRVDFDGSGSFDDERNLHELKDGASIEFIEDYQDDFWITLEFKSEILWDSLDNFTIFTRNRASDSDEELEVHIYNYSSGSWEDLSFLICDSTGWDNETTFINGDDDYWKKNCDEIELKIRLMNTEFDWGMDRFYIDQFCLFVNLTKDEIAPSIMNFQVIPANPFTNETILINATVIDIGTGVKRVEFLFNGAIGLSENISFSIEAYKSGNFYYIEERLVDGNWTITVEAVDYSENYATNESSLIVKVPPCPPFPPTILAPSLIVLGNDTTLEVNQWVEILIICQNTTSNVSSLWYRDPFTFVNHTLLTNFNGTVVFLLNFSTSSPGIRQFRVWAKGFDGGEVYDYVFVEWIPIEEIFWNLSVSTYNLKSQLQDTVVHLYRIDGVKTLVEIKTTIGGEVSLFNLSSLSTYKIEVYYWGFLVGSFAELKSRNPRWIQIDCWIGDIIIHLEWINGEPIESVNVSLYFNQTYFISGLTNVEGNYTFYQIPAVAYFLIIRFEEEEICIPIESGEEVSRRITFAIAPTEDEGAVNFQDLFFWILLVLCIILGVVVAWLLWERQKQEETKPLILRSERQKKDWIENTQ